jgi:hypothetical protein
MAYTIVCEGASVTISLAAGFAVVKVDYSQGGIESKLKCALYAFASQMWARFGDARICQRDELDGHLRTIRCEVELRDAGIDDCTLTSICAGIFEDSWIVAEGLWSRWHRN